MHFHAVPGKHVHFFCDSKIFLEKKSLPGIELLRALAKHYRTKKIILGDIPKEFHLSEKGLVEAEEEY